MTTIDRTITTPEEVEAVAAEREGETIDYKGTEKKDAWWELAKDIAAFANHLGGVVLLGAFERDDGSAELRGLPPDEVTALVDAYETAARDKCCPSPLVACKRIPWKEGREMLAVNVRAYLGLVGAVHYAARKDAKNPDGPLVMVATKAWQFPIRVGNDNVPLPLEQAIMHMSAHVRRVAILLASVPDRTKVALAYHRPDLPRHPFPPVDCRLTDVSIENNVATFVLDGRVGETTMIPLDDVDAVWAGDGGRWLVRVSGFLDDGTGRRVYQSRPRGRS